MNVELTCCREVLDYLLTPVRIKNTPLGSECPSCPYVSIFPWNLNPREHSFERKRLGVRVRSSESNPFPLSVIPPAGPRTAGLHRKNISTLAPNVYQQIIKESSVIPTSFIEIAQMVATDFENVSGIFRCFL